MIDFFGHLFYLSIMGGQALLTHSMRIGWGLRLTGDAGWAALGAIMGMSSIFVWGVMFTILDLYGFYEWKPEQPRND